MSPYNSRYSIHSFTNKNRITTCTEEFKIQLKPQLKSGGSSQTHTHIHTIIQWNPLMNILEVQITHNLGIQMKLSHTHNHHNTSKPSIAQVRGSDYSIPQFRLQHQDQGNIDEQNTGIQILLPYMKQHRPVIHWVCIHLPQFTVFHVSVPCSPNTSRPYKYLGRAPDTMLSALTRLEKEYIKRNTTKLWRFATSPVQNISWCNTFTDWLTHWLINWLKSDAVQN